MKREKLAGRSHNVMGEVFHVYPGASATHITFIRTLHRNAYATIDLAYADMVSGRGDHMVIWPGTHTPTASIAASKDRITIWGSEAWMGEWVRKPTSIIVGPAADEAFNITGADMNFYGLTCVPITAKSFADFTATADGLTVKGCHIDLATPVVNIATAGFVTLSGAAIDNLLFECNYALSDGAQGAALDIAGVMLNGKLKNNHYHVNAGTWASAVNLAAIDELVVDGDLATCGGTAMTACFTGSGTTVIAGVVFRNCHKGVLVTLLVDGFATTSHAEIVNNYTATIGGGTGSTLVTVIT
jgi:hypothetical protein